METQECQNLVDKQRIVIKIGSSSLAHAKTGEVNLMKIGELVRVISDLRGQGKDVVLTSSGVIAAGRQALGHHRRPDILAEGQTSAVVGQARLMMVYQKLFAEYDQTAAQVLLTKDTMVNDLSRYNARNTSDELLSLGTIPTVDENDTVSTSEIPYVDSFGDNDRLSVIMAALIGADLLILLSGIDGLYTDDPRENPEVGSISLVPEVTPKLLRMGKNTLGSDVGTGGVSAKLAAARIATDSGADMVITNGDQVDVILDIMSSRGKGTLFLAHANLDSDPMHYLNNEYQGRRPAGRQVLKEVNVWTRQGLAVSTNCVTSPRQWD